MDLKVLGIFLLPLIFRLGNGQDETSASTPEPEYVWKHYPKEVFPLVRKAFLDIASSDSKIAIFFHHFNGPVIPGLHYTGKLDYSRIPGPEFYYDWATKPVDDTTVTDQSADEALYTTIKDHFGDEALYTTVTDHFGDEALYTTVADHFGDEDLYTTVADQFGDESLYTTVADRPADEALYTTVADQSTDEALYTTVADRSADESYIDESKLSDIIEERLGLMFEELQELPEGVAFDDKMLERSVEDGVEVPLQVGSVSGIPGEHFPDYYDIPITSFSCADKKYIPGFYADLETGCQVFHVCWPHRRESFLCPVGTLFNQALLACDFWYSTNCSLAPLFFDVNSKAPETESSTAHTATMIDQLVKSVQHPTPVTEDSVSYQPEYPSPDSVSEPKIDWLKIVKFLPVKSKVVLYPESTASKITIKHSSLKPRPTVHDQESGKPQPTVHDQESGKPQPTVHDQESGKVKKAKTQKLQASEVFEIIKAAIADHKLRLEAGSNVDSLPKRENAYTLEIPDPNEAKLMPLPRIDPKFVVKPLLVFKKPVNYVPSQVTVEPVAQRIVPATLMRPAKVLKDEPSMKVKRESIEAIVTRGLKVADSVLQHNILQ